MATPQGSIDPKDSETFKIIMEKSFKNLLCNHEAYSLYTYSDDIIAVTKLSIAETFPVPSLGIEPGSPYLKTNALTTEPKSRLSDAVVRD